MVKDFENELFTAIASCKTQEEVRAFFQDLCTPGELAAMVERLRVCKLLDSGKYSYREIQQLTGVSATTVGRVARFLHQEPYQGYRLILDRINNK